MRHLSLLLIFFLVLCTDALAQADKAGEGPLRKNDWWIGTSIGVTHTLAENATSNDFLKNYPGVELQLGTFVSRALGFRLSLGLNPQAGRPGEAQREGDPEVYDTHYNFNVLTGYVDALVDLTTLFSKRKKYRPTFDMMLFAGGGMLESYHFDHQKVENWIYYPVDPWDKTFWAAHAGLMASYKIGKHWDWTLEGSYNITDSNYDGVDSGVALSGYVKLHTGWVYHFNDRTSGNVKLRNELDTSWEPSYTEKDRQRAAKAQAERIAQAREANNKMRAKRRAQVNERIEEARKANMEAKAKQEASLLKGKKSYQGPGNWFIGFDLGSTLSMAENVKAEDFFKTRIPSASLQIGRTMSPWVSMRLTTGYTSQIGYASEIANKYEPELYTPYRFNTASATLDALLNITNLCRRYDERNWFDAYWVMGGGAQYSFGFDKKVEDWEMIYPVDTKELLTWTGRVGLMGAWHVAKGWDLNAEIDLHATDNAYNGVKDQMVSRPMDFYLSMRIGMTYYFKNSKGRHRYANPQKEHRFWK